MRSLTLVAGFLLLCACQSTKTDQQASQVLLDDTLFPEYAQFVVESQHQVFMLSDEAKAFVDNAIQGKDSQEAQIAALVSRIFDRTDFNLRYLHSANTIVSKTFENRSANCLSLTIMTYAMARYAGFRAYMQDIDIPEYWTRQEGTSLLNGHVNVAVEPVMTSKRVRSRATKTVVDFDRQQSRRHFPVRQINQNKALAMFYNNKGANALIEGLHSQAYAYFKAATNASETYGATYVNLGILYRRNGHNRLAKNVYRKAIELSPDNLTAWENLAYVFAEEGDEERANAILARVERARDDNPFYHFILGEQAFEAGQMQAALNFYKAAYRLDERVHEVLFGLSKTYYQLGDISRSVRYLDMAEKNTEDPAQAKRYRGKLFKLQSAR